MEWGEHLPLLEANAKRGVRVKALETRPKLHDDLAWIYEAFWLMSRPMGYGCVGKISVQEITHCLDLHGIEDFDERMDFAEAINLLDVVYLNRANRREPKKDGNTPGRN